MQIPDPFYAEKKCPACRKISQGDFCMHCGEKLVQDRITFKRFIRGIPFIFFNFDHKFFRTVYFLAKCPGAMVRNYFSGDRHRYYKPISFFMFIGGLIALLYLSFHIGGTNDKVYEELLDDKELGKKLDIFANQFIVGTLFIQFPIVAFFTWLFFRKRKYTYGEHMVANAFFIGEVSLYWIILFPVFLVLNKSKNIDLLYTSYSVVIVIYYAYAFFDWFYEKRTWKGFFISLIFVIILYLFIMILSLILIVPFAYAIKTGIGRLFP